MSSTETTTGDTTPPESASLYRLVSTGILAAFCLVLIGLWLLVVASETWSALAVFAASFACGGLAYIAWQEGAAQRGETLANAGEVDLRLIWDLLVRYREVILVSAITAVAAALRLWALDSVPPGLHGDEAWTGIDAHRVLREGWIGPYVGSALGQPAGPLYWAAAVLKVTGDSVYAVRFSMAVLGIATIPIVYFAGRAMFDRTTGVVAAVMLAFLAWHLIYSRIAFMVISWPLIEVLVAWLLFAGIRQHSARHFALAGVALGLGVYTYNAYVVFPAGVGAFLILLWLQSKGERRQRAKHIALLGVCAVVVALPMLLFVADPDKDYFAHHRSSSYLRTEVFEEAGVAGKVDLLADRWVDWFEGMVLEARPDGSDGSGSTPILHWTTSVLVLAGIAFCIRDIRRLESQFLVIMLLVLPLAAPVTIGAGVRRTLGLVPFLAVLAAIPLARAWLGSQAISPPVRSLSRIVVVGIAVATAALNADLYFNKVAESSVMAFTFPVEITRTSEYMASVPGKPYVYFLSDRWGFNYETRRYLAPGLSGEDRSTKFGERQDFEVDRARDSLFILLPPYLEQLEAIRQRYPDGKEYHGRVDDRTVFIGYYLPAERSDVPPRPDPGALAQERDENRRAELKALSDALVGLRAVEGSYPSTEGRIQSSCVYRAIDKLCVLESQLGPGAFVDSRNDPERFGYWYKSDGASFTLFASMESPVPPGETCPPEEHLRRIANVLCLNSPPSN